MSMDTIGKRIRFFREENKWSQEVFAEKLGLSLTYIGMIERGEKIPKLETFIKITNTLGVSADQLLAGVLTTGYSIKSTEMTAKIEQLPPEEQEKIYDVVDIRSGGHYFMYFSVISLVNNIICHESRLLQRLFFIHKHAGFIW